MENIKSKFVPAVIVFAGLLSCVMPVQAQTPPENFDHVVIDAMVRYRTLGLKERMQARPELEKLLENYAKHQVAALVRNDSKGPRAWSYEEADDLFDKLKPYESHRKTPGSWKEAGSVSFQLQAGSVDMNGLEGGKSLVFEEIPGNPFQKPALSVSSGDAFPGKLTCYFRSRSLYFKYTSGASEAEVECRLTSDGGGMLCRERNSTETEKDYRNKVYRAYARK